MNGQPPAADPSNLTVHDPDPPHATAGGSSEPWHPKLTVHRALIISLTTGFGLAKAILSYRGKSVAPTTIEWVFGVVVTLL